MINPVIHYPWPLPAVNYILLPDHCPYTNYSHISTIGPLVEWDMSATTVKSTSADGSEFNLLLSIPRFPEGDPAIL